MWDTELLATSRYRKTDNRTIGNDKFMPYFDIIHPVVYKAQKINFFKDIKAQHNISSGAKKSATLGI